MRLPDSQHDLARELAFVGTDPELQRWRSVGLTIATIVDELQMQRAEAPSVAAAPAKGAAAGSAANAPAPAPAKPAALPDSHTRLNAPAPRRDTAAPQRFLGSSQLEIGGLGGTGLVRGALRGGVYARGARNLAGLPAFANVMLAYTLSSSQHPPSVTWAEIGLGGGFYWEHSPIRLELGAELELVRTAASARALSSDAIDSGERWLPAANLGVHAVWPERGPLSVLLGVRGAWSAREVVVTNAGQEIGRAPAHSVGALFGVRFTL